MQQPDNFTKIINKTRYSTKNATLIADNRYWDGQSMERHGRNSFLYKTQKGNWFVINLTMWQGERDDLLPLTEDEAYELYQTTLTEHHVPLETAFPNVQIEDA